MATGAQLAYLLDLEYFRGNDSPFLFKHSSTLFNADFSVLSQYCDEHGLSKAYEEVMGTNRHLRYKNGTVTNMGYLFSDQCASQIEIFEESGFPPQKTYYEFSGPYFVQINSALEKLNSYNPFRQDQSFALPYDYPPDAITALMYHAVRFRDYSLPGTIIFHVSDHHIEVSFPGTLVPPFELEDYMNGGSYPKDPEMSKMLKKFGIDIFQYGDFSVVAGIYDSYGIQPKYSISAHVIRISLPNINRSPIAEQFPTLSAKERDVLDLIYLRYCVSRRDVEAELQFPQATAIRTLNALVEKKLIEKIGSGRNTLYHSRPTNSVAANESSPK